MIGDLFDSPWKILIIALVILVLFGSKKLPDAARSLGKSMRILKTEVNQLHDDEEHKDAAAHTAAAQPAPAQITQQSQVDNLQQQLDTLRKQQLDEVRNQQSAAPETQQTHQAS
jgi:sec-independent protein translocase protein TatA